MPLHRVLELEHYPQGFETAFHERGRSDALYVRQYSLLSRDTLAAFGDMTARHLKMGFGHS